MKQKSLVTSLIIVAAIAFVAIVGFFSQNFSYKRLESEKIKLENELKESQETLGKIQAALTEANKKTAEFESKLKDILKAKELEAGAKLLGEQLELAIAKAKEGVEHPIIRQEAKNKKLLEARLEAHRLAIRGGFVDLKTGREVRIRGKGGNIAFPLEKDEKGNVTGIAKHKKDAGGEFKHVITRKLSPDFKGSKFLGDIKGGVQPDEYVHKRKRKTD
ncbi:MAG: hypothetical protein A2Y98_02860 [Candidatus Portnoybacteria bacterium RBG_19FT_COMBO_36_7]|uniref:Uncharacterized protein n=1 Tax=Candidatus Portnoybacteria bacterium RBG_19FT_COMBO_36_7 TaxID=1801992 RepID=A0A1G2FAX5_9BACT|nr:MAG: hypothetical protein A2Y98_02860 [Candidatus Portnoybacteria bacterium RBG_19FT_COMBO_36_7]